MANSEVKLVNNQPKLFVKGKEIPACAYVTYFDERNKYEDFTNLGYNLFSVTMALASRPINSSTGFTPYQKGVFDNENAPDFSCVDDAIERIVKVCPNAYIFPRIYITMPKWWVEKYPNETINTPDGEVREMLISHQFRADGCKMLTQVIEHIRNSTYADNIIGYHLAGGCTEEWFHFGRQGGWCENVKPYFDKFMTEKYPNEEIKSDLPDLKGMMGQGEIDDISVQRYLEFSNTEVAQSILCFAKTVKQLVEYKQTVGVFYGYTMDICSGLLGDLGIEELLNEKEIDFFCSPNSYYGDRKLGVDWGDMIASGSVKSHGKLCLLECDIRTSLSDYINNCRPGADKNNLYYGKVWLGPKTIKNSVYAMRKSFAHQITRGNGMWWFDMWGGWYEHNDYLTEAKRCLKLYKNKKLKSFDFKPEIAIFVDGKLYQRQCIGSPSYRAHYELRNSLGNSGIPYENYLLSDFEKHYKDYKAIILPITVTSNEVENAVELCKAANIPYILTTFDKWYYSPKEVREFAKNAGIWAFCESDDVIYFGNGILGIHAASKGEKIIKLPKEYKIKNLATREKLHITDKITLNMNEFETQLFVVENLK